MFQEILVLLLFYCFDTFIKKSNILIENVNVNPSRAGIINILNNMGANIKLRNTKIYNGEKISNISVRSNQKLKSVNCSPLHNTSAIDEFLIIFLVAAKAKVYLNLKI